MVADTVLGHRGFDIAAAARVGIAALVFSFAGFGSASAYVGPSFIQIPGTDGGWQGKQYKDWFKVDANYWAHVPIGLGNVAGGMRRPTLFAGPSGPAQGAGQLMIAVDKDSAILPQFMDMCVHKTAIPELTYAESSDRSRTVFATGARPASIPEYYEYKLKDVQFSDCPLVAEAPQQAFVVSFNDIEWMNYHLKENSVEAQFEPTTLKPAPASRTTKSFVLTWFALAQDVSADQCPVMNTKPMEDDYYALMSKEDADKERAELASKGGINYQNGQMGLRGPHKLNAALLPGIVRDPGNAEPQTKLARGLNLDGDDGTAEPPAGTCKHKNYVSADGRTGIDNQLYTVEGCIASYQGHKGFYMQFANNQMHDGMLSILVQITGIDNEQNDNSVEVTLFYSLDPMVKNVTGSQIVPNYTFRVSDKPEYAGYFTRLHGRIVNGVVITDPVKELQMNLGTYGTPVHMRLWNAGLRLQLNPDGTAKGLLGGYQDWRMPLNGGASSAAEQVHNFQLPGLFNALRRAADGMKDPVTGQCNGISSAFDMEGVPAFIGPAAPKVAKDKEPKDHRQVAQAGAPTQSAP